ncbi:hypothetical protein JRG19_03215 [Pseudoclavibacter alba]|uniref:hypothetical protein n=1 Tax=Pseudoclavibacter albus TaxID=272241 RepID=UPI0019D14831|nr:hypothetical protein [Pseudoclavibacter alba]MBN6777560.1 hypothetical protein [Pseudoclavibacter alba]
MSNTSTHIDDLIRVEREAAAKRIAKLRRQAAREQARVDERLLSLLREGHPDLAEHLEVEARAALDAERARRSAKAKAARAARSSESADEAPEAPLEPQGGWLS